MSNINLATLKNHLPDNWDYWPYTTKNYVTFEVEKDSAEYNEIESELLKIRLGLSVSCIKRIQNPFAYGRFVLRKEQFEYRSTKVELEREFYSLDESDVDLAIDCNLDERKISLYSVKYDVKKCVIVVKTMESDFVSCGLYKRDCNHYPEYIIYLE